MFEEIYVMKELKFDIVIKFVFGDDINFEKICKKLDFIVIERVIVRLVVYFFLKKKIDVLKVVV